VAIYDTIVKAVGAATTQHSKEIHNVLSTALSSIADQLHPSASQQKRKTHSTVVNDQVMSGGDGGDSGDDRQDEETDGDVVRRSRKQRSQEDILFHVCFEATARVS
jgi:hypothetical protein